MTGFKDYIERMETIRRLSTPSVEEIGSADEYSQVLRRNFTEIGKLAALNRDFLDNAVFPMIASERFGREEIEELNEFCNDLICAENAENLDLPMVTVLSDRLCADVLTGDDLYAKIEQMDIRIGVLYELTNMTGRIGAYPEISEKYRKAGFEIGDFFFSLLEKENFERIEDVQLRQVVITNARYSIAFFEGIRGDQNANAKQLERLGQMLDIAGDRFYIDLLEDYDWIYHRFRTLQYCGMTTENNNAAGFIGAQLEWIYERCVELMDFWKQNHEYLTDILGSEENTNSIELIFGRIEYLTGRITSEAYWERMLEVYNGRESTSYSSGRIYANLVVPVELFYALDKEHIPERSKSTIFGIYNDTLVYLLRMPNSNTLTVMLEYIYRIINDFIEVPSCITFENMVLQCMAAIHPPTYVHSQMVGLFTECICGHVIRLMPEKLTGACGCETVEEVSAHRGEILNFAYHAALCHDFGKISIIDTVLVYGRKLLDLEFDLIKTHPKTGYELMKKFASTSKYADIALGHHKWYDNSKGYPADFDTSSSREKAIIDIVMCADCLDAATDTIGRSYSKGKRLDEFTAELKEGAGTRYAPWLAQLFDDSLVRSDIEYLLEEGRQKEYRNTYFLLKNVHER